MAFSCQHQRPQQCPGVPAEAEPAPAPVGQLSSAGHPLEPGPPLCQEERGALGSRQGWHCPGTAQPQAELCPCTRSQQQGRSWALSPQQLFIPLLTSWSGSSRDVSKQNWRLTLLDLTDFHPQPAGQWTGLSQGREALTKPSLKVLLLPPAHSSHAGKAQEDTRRATLIFQT